MREDIESIETSRQSFLAAFEDLSSRVQKLELERQEGQRAFATLEAGLHGAHREIDGVATNVEELRISTATSSSLLDKMQAELAQLRLDLYGTDTSVQPPDYVRYDAPRGPHQEGSLRSTASSSLGSGTSTPTSTEYA